MTPTLLAALQDARAQSQPVVLATRLPDGAQLLLPGDAADAAARGDLAMAAAGALLRDEARTVTLADGATWFLRAYNPRPRLILVGAVHIAQALAPMAGLLGLEVIVVDPRRSFASNERFPGMRLMTEWPDEALDALRLDTRTAVVTLTHDPKLDDPALDRALKSDAFYIGALGSRKTHAKRLDRLREMGHGEDALARIRGPVGLNIGAVTAPEIALSVLAQIVAVRRGAPLA